MSGVIDAARTAALVAAAHADAGESDRRLAAPVVEALVSAGLMRLCVPACYGGPEATPMEFAAAIEEVASADGAAGWCVMIGSTTSSMSLFLAPDHAQEIFGDPTSVASGVFAPRGTAVPTDSGWSVSGRWQWGSGTTHSRWFSGGAVTADGEFHLMFMPVAELTVHDTWHTMGLRGTGSVDVEAIGAAVPRGRSVRPGVDRPAVDGALAAFPNYSLLAAGVAAVGLGIARHALAEIDALAQDKTPQFGSRVLAESGYVQSRLAEADASLRAARRLLHGELSDAWEGARDGQPVDIETRAALRLAGVHAAQTAATVVDTAHTLAGGTSVHLASPLQRCLRDIHVVTQHLMVSPRLYESLGRLRLGGRIDTATL